MWRCSWMKSGRLCVKVEGGAGSFPQPEGRGNVRVNRQFGIIYALVFPDRLPISLILLVTLTPGDVSRRGSYA